MAAMDYLLRRALDGIRASPAASGMALASVAASVVFAGAVLLLASNAYRAVAHWAASGIDVSVYFRPDAAEPDVVAARSRIQDNGAVVDLRYVSQEEAWQFLTRSIDGPPEVLAGIVPSVLPASLEVRLDRDLPDDDVDALVAAWRLLPGVSDVQSTRAEAVSGTTAADIVRWVAWAMGSLALVVSLLLVMATFQLVATTRREEMDVLRLLGAVGPGYWGPVVLAGVLLGLLAATGALVVLGLLFEAVALPVRASLPALASRISFLGTGQVATLMLWGAMLGGVGSVVGLRRVSAWR